MTTHAATVLSWNCLSVATAVDSDANAVPVGPSASVVRWPSIVSSVEGTLAARVRVSESGSLWRAWGGWVGWMAMGAVAGGLATRFFVDRKKRLA